MTEEYITRKEFEERMRAVDERLTGFVLSYEQRHASLQSQLSENLAISRENGKQITALAQTTKTLEIAITKAATYNKVLWPLVSVCVALIGYVLGGKPL